MKEEDVFGGATSAGAPTRQLADEYFEALGAPKPGRPFGPIDGYRFALALEQLAPGSVLDVGAYLGDVLMAARNQGREIAGTDVNATRVALVNSLLGADVVVEAFRNGSLEVFDDRTYDNVVCTEVLEHVPDNRYALSELCRVARCRVIITVPFREKINEVLCIHCNRYTPLSGHLHSYDYGSFTSLAPRGWRVVLERPFATLLTRRLASRLPRAVARPQVLRWLDRLPRGRLPNWILVVLEPT